MAKIVNFKATEVSKATAARMAKDTATHANMAGTLLTGFVLSLGTSAAERAAHLCQSGGAILALHLCNQPPKGMGAPQDYRHISNALHDTGKLAWMQYAGAVTAKRIDAQLAELGYKGRSVDDWAEACQIGATILQVLIAGIREAQAAKTAKAAKTKDANKGTVAIAMTCDGVLALIASGQFTPEELGRIGAACALVLAQPIAEIATA